MIPPQSNPDYTRKQVCLLYAKLLENHPNLQALVPIQPSLPIADIKTALSRRHITGLFVPIFVQFHWTLLFIQDNHSRKESSQIYFLDPTGQTAPDFLKKQLRAPGLFPKVRVLKPDKTVLLAYEDSGPWIIEVGRNYLAQGHLACHTNTTKSARREHREILSINKSPQKHIPSLIDGELVILVRSKSSGPLSALEAVDLSETAVRSQLMKCIREQTLCKTIGNIIWSHREEQRIEQLLQKLGGSIYNQHKNLSNQQLDNLNLLSRNFNKTHSQQIDLTPENFISHLRQYPNLRQKHSKNIRSLIALRVEIDKHERDLKELCFKAETCKQFLEDLSYPLVDELIFLAASKNNQKIIILNSNELYQGETYCSKGITEKVLYLLRTPVEGYYNILSREQPQPSRSLKKTIQGLRKIELCKVLDRKCLKQGKTLGEQGNVQNAIQCLLLGYSLVTKVAGRNWYGSAEYLEELGNVYSHTPQAELAIPLYKHAQFIYESIHKNPRLGLRCQFHIACIYEQLSQFSEALKFFEVFTQEMKKQFGEKDINYAFALTAMGSILCNQGEYHRAIRLHELAKKVSIQTLDKHNTFVAYVSNNLGNSYQEIGRLEDANQEYRLVKDILRINKDLNTNTLLQDCNENMATILQRQEKHTEALQLLSEVLHFNQEHFGKEHQKTATTLRLMAFSFRHLGQYSKALEMYQKAKNLHIKTNGPNHQDVGRCLLGMAYIHLQEMRCQHAATLIAQTKELLEHCFENGHRLSADCLNLQGRYHSLQGHPKRALDCFTQAMNMYEQTLGKENAAAPECLFLIAKIYAMHNRYPEALTALEKSKTIITKLYGETHTQIAGYLTLRADIYQSQGEYNKALEALRKALSIYIKIYGNNHQNIATVNAAIASIYRLQGKYTKMVEHLETALSASHFQSNRSYKQFQIELELSRAYIEVGLQKEPSQRQASFDKALKLLLELLKYDQQIILKKGHELQPYDLLDHHTLVKEILHTYRMMGRVEEAAKLAVDHAKAHADLSPETSLEFFKEALRDYKALPKSNSDCYKIYLERSEIYYHQRRYSKAIATLNKALGYQKDSETKALRDKWQQELSKKMSFIDADLWAQTERCIESVYEIKSLYLFDLQKSGTLSEKTKNRTTECIIKFRNILDQVYRRFLTHAIYQPKGMPLGRRNIYFPLGTSKKSLENDFIKEKVYDKNFNSPQNVDLSRWHLTLCKNPGRTAHELLQLYGYLNESNRLTNKFVPSTPDPFNEFPATIAPYCNALLSILKEQHLKQVNKETLNPLNRIKLKIPTLDELKAQLVEKGYLKEQGGAYYLTKKADLTNPSFRFILDHFFQPYERQIRALAHTSSLHHYPHTERALFEAQQFYFFNESRNQKDPGHFKNNWLGPVTSIGNDSKHVRLTPQYVKAKLLGQSGTIRQWKMKVKIEYVEPDFYTWTFVHLFPMLTGEQRIAISRKIYHALSKAGIIERKGKQWAVVHPSATKFKQAIVDGKDHDSHVKEFRIAIWLNLTMLKQFESNQVADLLLQRLLQANYVDRQPDVLVNADKLLDRALEGVIHIVETLSKDLAPVRESRGAPQFDQISQHKGKNLQAADTPPKTIKALAAYDARLHETAYKDRQKGPKGRSEVAQLYTEAAEAISKNYPWLAVRYYQKALDDLTYLPDKSATHLKTSYELNTCYSELKLHIAAHRTLERTLAFRHDVKCDQTLKTQQADYTQKHAHIDRDINSQLEHAKEQLTELKYACFQALATPPSLSSIAKIQNRTTELMTKVHQILDQSFTRFSNKQMLLPTSGRGRQVSFPCQTSEAGLIRELKSKGLANLPSKYPKVFQCLLDVQPFTYHENDSSPFSWWEQIRLLANEVKHVQLRWPSPESLELDPKKKTIETSYFFPYTSQLLYEWSFVDIVGDLDVSKTIFKELKRINVIGNTRKVDLTDKNLSLFRSYVNAVSVKAPQYVITNRRKAAIEKLKKHLKDIKDEDYIRIFNRIINMGRPSIGDLSTPSEQQIHPLNILDSAIKETEQIVYVLFKPTDD